MDRIRIKFSQKNNKLFDEIWREYYPKLTVFLRTSYRLSEPDDLIQDIMLKVFISIDSYNPLYALSTWIYSIARNHTLDFLKKEINMKKTLTAVKHEAQLSPPRSMQTPETRLLEKELEGEIALFIQELPEAEREISYLRYYEELKYSQISRITGKPSGTVKYMIHNIKKKFEEYYGDKYEN